MATIIGGIGWILALAGWYLAYDFRKEALRLMIVRADLIMHRDEWQEKFRDENLRAGEAIHELNALKEAIRERAKQPVVVPPTERRVRAASYADIRKANAQAVLREQQIADQKDANTAFEE